MGEKSQAQFTPYNPKCLEGCEHAKSMPHH